MIYKIRYLPKAKNDIIEIGEHFSQFCPSVSQNFFYELNKKINLLQKTPYIGQKYEKYRKLVVKNYLVFYIVNLEVSSIDVYRILHQKRDIRKNL